MAWILTAAAAAAGLATKAPAPTAAPPTTAVSVHATATVRILSGVRLKLEAATNEGAPKARDAIVRLKDGSEQPARLIEFQ